MIFGSSLAFLIRFTNKESSNEYKREELNISLECLVYEKETGVDKSHLL